MIRPSSAPKYMMLPSTDRSNSAEDARFSQLLPAGSLVSSQPKLHKTSPVSCSSPYAFPSLDMIAYSLLLSGEALGSARRGDEFRMVAFQSLVPVLASRQTVSFRAVTTKSLSSSADRTGAVGITTSSEYGSDDEAASPPPKGTNRDDQSAVSLNRAPPLHPRIAFPVTPTKRFVPLRFIAGRAMEFHRTRFSNRISKGSPLSVAASFLSVPFVLLSLLFVVSASASSSDDDFI
mmetsp:Transcript_111277/g.227831  ORF Transcript_111277/g.227831 Transcript_111277/m.227831 type:complete len:234 (-) Transcript_111277:732-1433(-)